MLYDWINDIGACFFNKRSPLSIIILPDIYNSEFAMLKIIAIHRFGVRYLVLLSYLYYKVILYNCVTNKSACD